MPLHDHNETQKIAQKLQQAKRNIGCAFPVAGASAFGFVGFFVGATLGAGGRDSAGTGGVGAFVGVMVGIFIGGLLAKAMEAVLDWMDRVSITQAEILAKLEKKSDN